MNEPMIVWGAVVAVMFAAIALRAVEKIDFHHGAKSSDNELGEE